MEELKKAYKLTGNPMVGKLEFKLNDALNRAMIGKDRIKNPDSNKIGQWVLDYLKQEE